MRARLRLACFASVVTGALAAHAPAHAGPVEVTGYSVPYDVNVHSAAPGVSNEYSGAGQIDLKVAKPGGGSSDLLVWCVDLFDWLYVPATFTKGVLSTNGNGSHLSALQEDQITTLIEHGDAMLSGQAPVMHGYSLSEASSAIQIAIWSVENGVSYSFTSDDSALNGPGGLVERYVADVSGPSRAWEATPFSETHTISEPGGQTLATFAVPEPASIAVLGSGFLTLLAVWRRNGSAPRRRSS